MVLAVLIFLNALLSVNASPHQAPCENKAAGDPCEYGNGSGRGRGVCCTTLSNQAGERQKFCRNCDWPGVNTQGECTLRVTDRYLGCFRRAEDSLVFQTCHGVPKGSSCMYETAARGGWGGRPPTPAYNTTGVCLSHIYHQGVMCLEAIGDADDDECNGKALGQPCTHSESPDAICTHDPRSGAWMCSAPKMEAPVYAVCEGMEQGTPCSYTAKIDERFDHGLDSGLIQGACDLHDEITHTAMMCLAASAPNDDQDGDEEEEKSSPIIILAVAAASLLVGSVAGAGGGIIMQRRIEQKKPVPASQPDIIAGISYPQAAPVGHSSLDQKGEEVPSEASTTDQLV